MAGLSESVRRMVLGRASYRCEYCLTSQRVIGMPLVVDHILPKSLGGGDDPDNLCAACYRCNQYKGAKTHDFDHVTGEFVSLWNRAYIAGKIICPGVAGERILSG